MRCDIIAHMNDHSWKKTLQALFVPHYPGPEYHRILQDRRITDELV